MGKEVRFFQSVLQEIPSSKIMDVVYPNKPKGSVTLEERLPESEWNCPECNCNSWIVLPRESAAVKEGGKPYIECMNCGYSTHL
jgi:hypothetical protein